ncbi:winged helix-turn-helix domain-containing protein [Rhizobium johnstonii]|jgi:DNA-binding response OmpR family regulator
MIVSKRIAAGALFNEPLFSSPPMGKARQTVLIISSNPTEASGIRRLLEQHGFDASLAFGEADIDNPTQRHQVDLIIVDLNIGTEAGLKIVGRFASSLPVVILGDRSLSEADKVRGLEGGAEDFILKPFGRREFIARLRVGLRPRQVPERAYFVYSFANWSLNTRTRTLTKTSGEEVELSATEFNVLVTFLDHPETILSRQELIRLTRLHASELAGRSVDVLIVRLRRKIESGCEDRAIIKTVRGQGYMLAVTVEVRGRKR